MSAARVMRDWPLLPADSDLHRDINIRRSVPTSHDNLELQAEPNYVRGLRTHLLSLSLLMVKKFDALDRLEQAGHRVALVRARSRAEHYADPAWEKYDDALAAVKALDQEEEMLWRDLLAFRGGKVDEEGTSTPACAEGDDHGRVPATKRPSTGLRTCSDSAANDTSEPLESHHTCTCFRDYWFVMGQMSAATNNAVQHGLCIKAAAAANPTGRMQRAMSWVSMARPVLCQTPLVLCLLCFFHVGFPVLDQFLASYWPLSVKTLARLDAVIFWALELIGHALFRR